MQGDDYILYCHPSRQKTPRSDRLREWYLAMLRIAKEEGTVTHLSNLFDTFFDGGKDHRTRVSSTCLPYLEGAAPASPYMSIVKQPAITHMLILLFDIIIDWLPVLCKKVFSYPCQDADTWYCVMHGTSEPRCNAQVTTGQGRLRTC